MPREVNGKIYILASEAIEVLQVSRDTFYKKVKCKLTPYKHEISKWTYYLEEEVKSLVDFKPNKNK